MADKTGMTPALCNKTCADRGYSYAGTQAGYQCFCGNSFGKYGPASNCGYSCSGDSSQKCGGSWANSIFGLK